MAEFELDAEFYAITADLEAQRAEFAEIIADRDADLKADLRERLEQYEALKAAGSPARSFLADGIARLAWQLLDGGEPDGC